MTERLDNFRLWIKEQGLKATAQRDDIAQVFFSTTRHISVEELSDLMPRLGIFLSDKSVGMCVRIGSVCV